MPEYTLALVSLFSSIASLALAVLAIWIALYGKSEADRTNRRTQELLTDIRSDAKALAQVAMPELRAYGDSVRRFIFEGGSTSDSTFAHIERSVSSAMEKITQELQQVREAGDPMALQRQLDSLEAQLDQSRRAIEGAVKREEGNVVTIRGGEAGIGFPPSRKIWSQALNTMLRSLGLERDTYGTAWVLVNTDTGHQLSRSAALDDSFLLEDRGIRGGKAYEIRKL